MYCRITVKNGGKPHEDLAEPVIARKEVETVWKRGQKGARHILGVHCLLQTCEGKQKGNKEGRDRRRKGESREMRKNFSGNHKDALKLRRFALCLPPLFTQTRLCRIKSCLFRLLPIDHVRRCVYCIPCDWNPTVEDNFL